MVKALLLGISIDLRQILELVDDLAALIHKVIVGGKAGRLLKPLGYRILVQHRRGNGLTVGSVLVRCPVPVPLMEGQNALLALPCALFHAGIVDDTQTHAGIILTLGPCCQTLGQKVLVTAGDVNTGILLTAVKIHPQHGAAAGIGALQHINTTVILHTGTVGKPVAVEVLLPLPCGHDGRLGKGSGGILDQCAGDAGVNQTVLGPVLTQPQAVDLGEIDTLHLMLRPVFHSQIPLGTAVIFGNDHTHLGRDVDLLTVCHQVGILQLGMGPTVLLCHSDSGLQGLVLLDLQVAGNVQMLLVVTDEHHTVQNAGAFLIIVLGGIVSRVLTDKGQHLTVERIKFNGYNIVGGKKSGYVHIYFAPSTVLRMFQSLHSSRGMASSSVQSRMAAVIRTTLPFSFSLEGFRFTIRFS